MTDEPDDVTSPPTQRAGPGAAAPHPARKIARGDAIGRYVVEDPLGEGGMGVVYSANDPELARKVALKLVRPGGGSDSQARLVREAQAMARLRHPNVVAIYDVGMHGKHVFLAMELIEGETVRRWLKREPRDWRAVRDLFLGAGRGLAAAHAAGMVHRDFKLDNVLVERDGRARVTDFGLARAVDEGTPVDDVAPSPSPSLTSSDKLATPLTETGAAVGTPAYMAPEQRSPRAPSDALTDEYSFCVSLYEALYGKRPAGASDALRPPPSGSKVPPWLRKVVARGLSARRENRWPDMNALLAALSRDPATPRRRIAAGIGMLASAGAIAVLAVTLTRSSGSGDTCEQPNPWTGVWDDGRKAAVHAAFANTKHPSAEDAFTRTAAVLDQTTAAWAVARRAACEAHEQSQQDTNLRTTCLDLQREQIKGFVDVLAGADANVVRLAIEAATALPRANECDDVRTLETLRPPDDPKLRHDIESLRLELAGVRTLAPVGRPADAIARYQPIAERAERLGYRPLEAEAWFALGDAHYLKGEHLAAERAMKDAEAAAEAGQLDRLAARIDARMVDIARAEGRLDEAATWVTRARERLKRIGGDRVVEAELVGYIGILQFKTGHIEEGVDSFRRALELRSEVFGPVHPTTLVIYTNLGAALARAGRYDDAILMDRDSIRRLEEAYGPRQARLSLALNNLGFIYAMTGRTAEADPILTRAVDIARNEYGEGERLGVVLTSVAALRLEQRRPLDALEPARQAEAILLAHTSEKGGTYGQAVALEGAAFAALGKPKEALPLLVRGVAIVEAGDPGASGLLGLYTPLIETQLAVGDARAAIAAAEHGLVLCSGSHYPGVVARARFAAARALVATDRKRALELAQLAREELAPVPYRADLLADVDAFVRRLGSK
jgi:serine/threonine protein kinase